MICEDVFDLERQVVGGSDSLLGIITVGVSVFVGVLGHFMMGRHLRMLGTMAPPSLHLVTSKVGSFGG